MSKVRIDYPVNTGTKIYAFRLQLAVYVQQISFRKSTDSRVIGHAHCEQNHQMNPEDPILIFSSP